MLKNMKPPVFKGEECDRNKDAVHTFLHKWMDLHRLRCTFAAVMATETSLTLEGKAYKWWMSLPIATRPTTWEEFEAAFKKEFLPQNKKDQNWTAWDKCKMEGLTLTQYVSKYREVILKFSKGTGMEDKEYQAGYQYPKTLDAAKSALRGFVSKGRP